MTTITFDTLKYIKTLETGGVTRQQAEAQVAAERDALAEVFASSKDISASKEEVAVFKSELRSDLQTLELTLRKDMEIVKRDLTISMGTMFTVAVGLIAALIKFS